MRLALCTLHCIRRRPPPGARLFLCTSGKFRKFRMLPVAKIPDGCNMNNFSVIFACRPYSALGFLLS